MTEFIDDNRHSLEVSEKLTEFFDQHLPITEFMGLRVQHYNGNELVLHAPLEPNINDKSTAFGGSLYNAAVMACWGMAFLKTQEAGISCNQVIAEASVRYKAPVHGDIRAICKAPAQSELDHFFNSFKTKGKASIVLQATIECSGKLAVEFEGKYAILRRES